MLENPLIARNIQFFYWAISELDDGVDALRFLIMSRTSCLYVVFSNYFILPEFIITK